MCLKVLLLANSRLALPTLNHLLADGSIAGIAIPDTNNEVTEWLKYTAITHGIPWQSISQAAIEQDLEELIQRAQPDVGLAITFPYKIPASLLTSTKYGFFNCHPGSLPKYRGADPLFWQIRNGESHTAITVHKMDAGFDTGPIALQQEIPLSPGDTYGMQQSRLAYLCIDLTKTLLQKLTTNTLELTEQIALQPGSTKAYPRPAYEHVILDFEQYSREQIHAIVKACNPWNRGAFAFIGEMQLKIAEMTPANSSHTFNASPGTIVIADQQTGLFVICKNEELLKIEIVMLEEGIITGAQLVQFGIKQGDRMIPNLTSIEAPQEIAL